MQEAVQHTQQVKEVWQELPHGQWFLGHSLGCRPSGSCWPTAPTVPTERVHGLHGRLQAPSFRLLLQLLLQVAHHQAPANKPKSSPTIHLHCASKHHRATSPQEDPPHPLITLITLIRPLNMLKKLSILNTCRPGAAPQPTQTLRYVAVLPAQIRPLPGGRTRRRRRRRWWDAQTGQALDSPLLTSSQHQQAPHPCTTPTAPALSSYGVPPGRSSGGRPGPSSGTPCSATGAGLCLWWGGGTGEAALA